MRNFCFCTCLGATSTYLFFVYNIFTVERYFTLSEGKVCVFGLERQLEKVS